MDYRETFVQRALGTLRGYKGSISPEVLRIMRDVDLGKPSQLLTNYEYNLLQDLAERIETRHRITQIQRNSHRNAAKLAVDEMIV